jgi:hypothetical protein
MNLTYEARKIYADSVSLYKKSILLNRVSKKVDKHFARTKAHHPRHYPALLRISKEYEQIINDLSKRINTLKKGLKK